MENMTPPPPPVENGDIEPLLETLEHTHRPEYLLYQTTKMRLPNGTSHNWDGISIHPQTASGFSFVFVWPAAPDGTRRGNQFRPALRMGGITLLKENLKNGKSHFVPYWCWFFRPSPAKPGRPCGVMYVSSLLLSSCRPLSPDPRPKTPLLQNPPTLGPPDSRRNPALGPPGYSDMTWSHDGVGAWPLRWRSILAVFTSFVLHVTGKRASGQREDEEPEHLHEAQGGHAWQSPDRDSTSSDSVSPLYSLSVSICFSLSLFSLSVCFFPSLSVTPLSLSFSLLTKRHLKCSSSLPKTTRHSLPVCVENVPLVILRCNSPQVLSVVHLVFFVCKHVCMTQPSQMRIFLLFCLLQMRTYTSSRVRSGPIAWRVSTFTSWSESRLPVLPLWKRRSG